MDYVFWAGIALGAILGVAGSIIGNLWTDKVRSYLDNRRKISLSKTKSRELRRYYFAKALREGEPSSTIFYSLLQTYFIAAVSFLAVLVGFLIILFFVAKEPIVQQHFGIVRAIALWVCASGFLLLCVIQHLYIVLYKIWSRLRRFEQYESQIYEKWGDPVEPDSTYRE
jgi:hypothetical protein